MGVAPALMTHTSVSNYPDERRSVGSAINSMAVRFGLAFGVAAYGTLLAVTYKADVAPAAAGLSAQDQYDALESLGGALNVAQRADVAGLADAARDAYVAGFRLTLVVAAVVLVVLAVIVWRGLPARLDSPTEKEEQT